MPAPWRLSTTVLVSSEKTLPSMSLPTNRIAISLGIRLLRRTYSGGIATYAEIPQELARWYLGFSVEVTDFCRCGSPLAGAQFLPLPPLPGVLYSGRSDPDTHPPNFVQGSGWPYARYRAAVG